MAATLVAKRYRQSLIPSARCPVEGLAGARQGMRSMTPLRSLWGGKGTNNSPLSCRSQVIWHKVRHQAKLVQDDEQGTLHRHSHTVYMRPLVVGSVTKAPRNTTPLQALPWTGCVGGDQEVLASNEGEGGLGNHIWLEIRILRGTERESGSGLHH